MKETKKYTIILNYFMRLVATSSVILSQEKIAKDRVEFNQLEIALTLARLVEFPFWLYANPRQTDTICERSIETVVHDIIFIDSHVDLLFTIDIQTRMRIYAWPAMHVTRYAYVQHRPISARTGIRSKFARHAISRVNLR